jgi:cell division septation protein DedD
MTDIRADSAPLDEDRLPWLEAVEEQDEREGPSVMKLIVAVLIGLAAIGGIVGGIFWLMNREAAPTGEAELIKAPEGAYKVRPDDPGGMAVEGEGDTAFAASAGADPKGAIDPSRVPEAPVTKAQPQPQPQPPVGAAKEEPLLKAPAPSSAGSATPAPAPAEGGGATVQLGAFSSQASANNAWKALSGRFKYLAPLTQSVVPVTTGGKTLYRLRASGPGAASLCGRLRVAGESCVVVD